MKSRLSQIDKNLSEKILGCANLEKSKKLFLDLFGYFINATNNKIYFFLNNKFLENQLKSLNIPEGINYLKLSEDFDEKYLLFKETGQNHISDIYFTLARIMSSLHFYTNSKTNEDIEEAFYEIIILKW